MSAEKIAILQRALTREKAARKEAEKILEEKAAELYALSQELSQTNTRLEKTIQQKSMNLRICMLGVYEIIQQKALKLEVKPF